MIKEAVEEKNTLTNRGMVWDNTTSIVCVLNWWELLPYVWAKTRAMNEEEIYAKTTEGLIVWMNVGLHVCKYVWMSLVQLPSATVQEWVEVFDLLF